MIEYSELINDKLVEKWEKTLLLKGMSGFRKNLLAYNLEEICLFMKKNKSTIDVNLMKLLLPLTTRIMRTYDFFEWNEDNLIELENIWCETEEQCRDIIAYNGIAREAEMVCVAAEKFAAIYGLEDINE